jgi:hypothetical protein
MSQDFEAVLERIDREAKEEGPHAVAELQALQAKYRIVSQLIEGRSALHRTQKRTCREGGPRPGRVSKIELGRKSPTLDT